MPRPDFPKTIFEFQDWFPNEEACVKFLIESRWPDGFVCPQCAGREYFWLSKRTLLQCKQCGHQASPTAGTVMHRTKIPLKLWFNAAYLVTTLTPGLSAVQFQKQVGLKYYATAFAVLHKLRSAMVRQGRDKLSGIVEADETFIGGPKPGVTGRGALGKVLVAGAVDLRGKNANRVRLKVIPDASEASLLGFIKDNIEQGTVVRTDEWQGYASLERETYAHVVSKKELVHIHRAFSNLKTWLKGTHHGRVSPQHLQAYLNEFTFRFNRRGTPMAAFQTVLGLTGQRLGPTYKGLYGVRKGLRLWIHPTNASSETIG